MIATIAFIALLFYVLSLRSKVNDLEYRLRHGDVTPKEQDIKLTKPKAQEFSPLEMSIFGVKEMEDTLEEERSEELVEELVNKNDEDMMEGDVSMKAEENELEEPAPVTLQKAVAENHNVKTITKKKKKESFELKLGMHWFQWIGIAALVASLLFFLIWAFEEQIIGETGITIIGYTIVAIAMLVGDRTRKRYGNWSLAFTGGGALGGYIVTWIAMSTFNLIPEVGGFVIMALLSGLVCFLSAVYKSKPLAVFGILAGFIVPIVAGGNVSTVLLLSYILLLDVVTLVLAHTQKWDFLNLGSYVGTVTWLLLILERQGGIANDYISRPIFIFFIAIFGLLYLAIPIAYNTIRKTASSQADIFMIIINSLITFSIILITLHLRPSALVQWNGLVAAVFATIFIVYSMIIYKNNRVDKPLVITSISLSLLFAAVTIPMQFGTDWTAVMWMLMALMMMWLSVALKEKSFQNYAWPLMIGSFLWYFAVPVELSSIFAAMNSQPLLYTQFGFWWFLTLVVIFSGVSIGWLKMKDREEYQFLSMSMFVGVFLLICFLLNLGNTELSTLSAWQRLIEAFFVLAGSIAVITVARSVWSTLTEQQQEGFNAYSLALQVFTLGYILYEYVFAINENRLFADATAKEQLKAVGTSVIATIYALIVLIFGFIRDVKGLRKFGVIVLCVAIVKLTLVDVISLGTGYRIIGFAILGASLVGVSFLYQHFKDKLQDMLT